jgi:hypothetical protein
MLFKFCSILISHRTGLQASGAKLDMVARVINFQALRDAPKNIRTREQRFASAFYNACWNMEPLLVPFAPACKLRGANTSPAIPPAKEYENYWCMEDTLWKTLVGRVGMWDVCWEGGWTWTGVGKAVC